MPRDAVDEGCDVRLECRVEAAGKVDSREAMV